MTKHSKIDELQEIYNNTKDDVFSLCFRFFHDFHNAEDVSQEVYLRLLKKPMTQFQDIQKKRAYIMQMAYNLCIDTDRKRKQEQNRIKTLHNKVNGINDQHKYNPEKKVDQKILEDIIENELTRMKPEERFVYLLYAFTDNTLQEIQKITGKGLSRVRRTIENTNKNIFQVALKNQITLEGGNRHVN